MSGYTIIRELGRGSSGVVSLVRRKSDGRLFAAKEIMFTDADERNQIMAEVKLMQSLPQHPSLLFLEEVLEARSCVTMILEYSAEGTLADLVYGSHHGDEDSLKKTQGLAEEDVVKYLSQLVNALAFLHSYQVLHRDIKLENLLLFSRKAVVKISDFGVATILGRTSTGQDRMAQTTAGTPNYMSPEVCEGHPYNYKSDVWSLGVVAYELCCVAVPFQASNLLALSGKICHQATPDIPVEYSRRLNSIIKAMLTKNQDTRPSMREVAAMLQYYRKKRNEEGPDGSDIGGFTVDSTVLPNLLDDSDLLLLDDRHAGEEQKRQHQADPSWGAPSIGLPEEDDTWAEAEDPTADFEFDRPPPEDNAVYQTSDVIVSNPVSLSPHAVEYKSAERLGTPLPRKTTHSPQDMKLNRDPSSSNQGAFSPDMRNAIFEEGRRQAALNKGRVQSEARRVSHDDASPQPPDDRPKTPKLRSLIEELQDEMRKQSQKVEQMISSGKHDLDVEMPNHSSKSVNKKRGAAAQRSSSSSPPPPLSSANSVAAVAADGAQPFVDPAASTPSAVRKMPSPRKSSNSANNVYQSSTYLQYSPREGSVPSAAQPAQQKQQTPTTKPITPPPQIADPKLAAATSNVQPSQRTSGGGLPKATPRQESMVTPKPTPRQSSSLQAPPPLDIGSGTPNLAKSQPPPPRMVVRGSIAPPSIVTGGGGDPYFPPCAQCIKVAKEKKASTAAGGSMDASGSDGGTVFVTINPSKFYCSTCHAPLCQSCSDLVHDSATTITNLTLMSSTSVVLLNTSAKRHNLYFLSVNEPNAGGFLRNESFGCGPASPTASRRALVTFHVEDGPSVENNKRTNKKDTNEEGGGCCTLM